MNQVMAQIRAEQQTSAVRASLPLLAYLLFPDLPGVSSHSGAAAVIFSDLLETKKREFVQRINVRRGLKVLRSTFKHVLTAGRVCGAASGMRTGSGSERPGSERPGSLLHSVRTRAAGWETLSASFRTAT